VLTGLAGLVAGAFSMGTGEYVSVTNQNELVHAEVALEADMHARFPQQEYDELVDRFQAYGADTNTAQRMATAVSNDPEQALRVHTRDELGVDPDDLPSPMLAGGASFAAFSLGAVLPLVPYLLGVRTLIPSLVLTAIALLAGGMTVGTLTGRLLLRSGARQLLLGALAVAVPFTPTADPPPTPAISAALVTSPSTAPNTVGRSHTPDTSRCRWVHPAGSVGPCGGPGWGRALLSRRSLFPRPRDHARRRTTRFGGLVVSGRWSRGAVRGRDFV
jgi:VIT1/CCC1 family predicted Fe2+/Mn2+ transporter